MPAWPSVTMNHSLHRRGFPAKDGGLMVTEHSLGHGTLTSIPCGAGCIVAGGIQLSHSQYLNVKDVYLCPCMIRHIWQLLGPPVMSCMVEARAQGSSGQMMKALYQCPTPAQVSGAFSPSGQHFRTVFPTWPLLPTDSDCSLCV